jgi:hypothetical protein
LHAAAGGASAGRSDRKWPRCRDQCGEIANACAVAAHPECGCSRRRRPSRRRPVATCPRRVRAHTSTPIMHGI